MKRNLVTVCGGFPFRAAGNAAQGAATQIGAGFHFVRLRENARLTVKNFSCANRIDEQATGGTGPFLDSLSVHFFLLPARNVWNALFKAGTGFGDFNRIGSSDLYTLGATSADNIDLLAQPPVTRTIFPFAGGFTSVWFERSSYFYFSHSGGGAQNAIAADSPRPVNFASKAGTDLAFFGIPKNDYAGIWGDLFTFRATLPVLAITLDASCFSGHTATSWDYKGSLIFSLNILEEWE